MANSSLSFKMSICFPLSMRPVHNLNTDVTCDERFCSLLITNKSISSLSLYTFVPKNLTTFSNHWRLDSILLGLTSQVF